MSIMNCVDMSTVGGRIKQIRLTNGMTQDEFARRINYGKSHLANVEAGISKASDKMLNAISLAFSVDRTWLATGAEPFTAAADCQDAAREPETSGNAEVKEVWLNASEMENVLLRLQCVYDTLMLIHIHQFSKPLYCAADELSHITDDFRDFLEKAEQNPELSRTSAGR